MSILDSLKQTLSEAAAQITTSTPIPKDVYFTSNFQMRAKQWGLSEKDALDVLHHGSKREQNMLVRTYNGYEIGIYSGRNTRTGQVYISSIWKRQRR